MSVNTCSRTVQPDGTIIISCTGQPAISSQPERYEVDRRLGWNASARSIKRLGDSVYTEFAVPEVVGVVIGFTKEGAPKSEIRNVSHGFYFEQTRFRVYEGGWVRTEWIARDSAADTYRIERRNNVVVYYHNTTLVYVSLIPSWGDLSVASILYAAGDMVI